MVTGSTSNRELFENPGPGVGGDGGAPRSAAAGGTAGVGLGPLGAVALLCGMHGATLEETSSSFVRLVGAFLSE